MRSADDAMRRRMQVIPFKHKPATVDKSLREKLQAELGGILCWAVEGEIERRRMGLKPPRVVTEATDEYFKSENTIGRWLDERCTLDRERFTSTKELYRDFQEWARGVGEFVVAERIFSEKLDQTGHVQKGRDPSGDRRGFRGVALLAVDSGGSLFGSPGSTSHGGFLPGHDDPAEQWSRE
jgi:putative DNA primase/helicase